MADGFGDGSYSYGDGGYSYGDNGSVGLGDFDYSGVGGPFQTGGFGEGGFGSLGGYGDFFNGGAPSVSGADPYAGYSTGQWGDRSSGSYDSGYSGGLSFGDSIQATLRRMLQGLGVRGLGQRMGSASPLAGPLVAGAMAPNGQRMAAAGDAFASQTVNGLLAGVPVLGPLNLLSGMLGGPSLGRMVAGMATGAPGQGYGDSTNRGGPGMSGYGAALSLLSGIDGMRQARGISNSMAPFDQYRGGFASRAAALESDPRRLMSSPGYRAGLQAVQRAMAAQGYTGSGNAAVRIAEFGNDFFNRESARLANLGGAGAAPGAGAVPAAMLRGQGLASLAYGLEPIANFLSQEWGG